MESSGDLGEDRAVVRDCLNRASSLGELQTCLDLVQARCWASLPTGDNETTAQQRWCHLRSSLAWEGELEVTMSQLRELLGPPSLAQLLIAQRAWEETVSADTKVFLGVIDDNVMGGAEAAGVRARAIAERVVFLEYVMLMAELNANAN